MKRLISLLLALSLLMGSLIYLTSCGSDGEPSDNPDEDPGESLTPPAKPEASIITPEYKDYGRGTVDFDTLTYSRPSIAALISDAEAITARITEGEDGFEDILADIESLSGKIEEMFTMRALAEIYSSRDSSVVFWNEESEYLETNYPAYLKSVKDMMVAAANSVDAERYENEVFGEGLIEEYRDGTDYTDEVVALLAEEARLEAVYSGYSTATVVITDTLTNESGTVDSLLQAAKEAYGEGSQAYTRMETYYNALYEVEVLRLSSDLFVDLVRVRRQIADELGLSSYTEFAYEEMGYEYDPGDTEAFLSEIKESVLPVYNALYEQAFRPTMQQTLPDELDRIALVNTVYSAWSDRSSVIADIYRYMLQHGLYDIDVSTPNRFQGAFTTYVDKNSSPFIFMSTTGYNGDLLTLSHELGHFVDGYINLGESSSLDTAEVSSQGLEYLTLLLLKDDLSEEQYRYLEYHALSSALETLLYQGFYSTFEHLVYKIPYEEISTESITDAVKAASVSVFGFDDYDRIQYVMIPHTILFPHYVQSYCTSVVPSLELFFLEANEGKGLDAYLNLVERESSALTFAEYLSDAGLCSPFDTGVLRDIADKMHYYVLGSHYFKGSQDEGCNAA